MTTRLSCWTDWILRLAAVAGIMASRDRVQSRRLRTWTIQHLLRRRLAQEFEHFAAVSREWNRLAKWQLGADFRQRNPGIRPIWGARRHQTRGIRRNSIDERLPGSGKLREPPRANWASRGDLAGKFGERAGRHRNWRGRSTICEHRHHRLPLLPRSSTLHLWSLQPSLCRKGAKQRNRKHHRHHARYHRSELFRPAEGDARP